MSGQAKVQGPRSQSGPWTVHVCECGGLIMASSPVCGRVAHGVGRDVEVVPRSVAEALAGVLEGVEACGELSPHEIEIVAEYRSVYPKETS